MSEELSGQSLQMTKTISFFKTTEDGHHDQEASPSGTGQRNADGNAVPKADTRANRGVVNYSRPRSTGLALVDPASRTVGVTSRIAEVVSDSDFEQF
jgi:hypothetical protein